MLLIIETDKGVQQLMCKSVKSAQAELLAQAKRQKISDFHFVEIGEYRK